MSWIGEIKELPSLLREYKSIWRTKLFIICIIIAELIIYRACIYSEIKELNFHYIEFWLPAIFILFTYAIWLIVSQRLFFRDSWKVLCWGTIYIVGVSLFPLWIYPNYLQTSTYNIPYIHIWGAIIIALVLWFILKQVKHKFFQDTRLIIAFTVTCDKSNIENRIRESIDHTILNIENKFDSIKIIVPPFGFKPKLKDCERYIKRHITQADALIYARLMDGTEDGNLGYIFTEFTSRVNENRHANLNSHNNSFLNTILEQQRLSKEWNTVNISKTDALSKLKVAENLEGMLLMYCSALYMFKNDYTTALPVAKRMYNIEGTNRHSIISRTAANLLSFAYLASALKLEHEQHDFDAAYNNILECRRLFPILTRDINYLKSMARLSFYRKDIKASKSYTKEFKKIEGDTWGYNLNMGFYALYENKVDEWIVCYKRLMRFRPTKQEVNFAIEFLEYELQHSNRDQYSLLLNCAITYLTMYVNPTKAKRAIKKLTKDNSKDCIMPKIEKLFSTVNSNNKILLTCN
jgi:hypothetical protein